MNTYTLHHGNNLDVLPTIGDNTIDSIVTDPPYELGFMGKKWDATGIAYNTELWRECLRVLKPGGHLLAFGGTRTYHRMAVAIEDAGFEIRDSIHWLYGSGFPKSLDVSKAIDKQAGAEREVSGITKGAGIGGGNTFTDDNWKGIGRDQYERFDVPVTDEAKQWEGWGTALKPAHEPIVLARKPFTGTVANNVLQHGTGALNINACRLGYASEADKTAMAAGVESIRERGGVVEGSWKNSSDLSGANPAHTAGRWPANIIIDDTINDDWARYFYCAKPSKKERNAGLQHLPQHTPGEMTNRKENSKGLNNPRAGAGRTTGAQNHHPTVKPIALMQYLIRLITPPAGIVLDPFAGSGTTLAAAITEGCHPIGIELTEEYLPIIHARCQHATTQPQPQPDPTLFNND